MIIAPKVRGFICTTTHPTGCEANVKAQIEYVQKHGKIENGAKKVLVIGASTGYGLASRISAAFGSGAATIGVFFENLVQKRNLVQLVGITQLLLINLQRNKVYMQRALMAMRFLMNVEQK
jgi:trans-2-enoyl-CoA reductase